MLLTRGYHLKPSRKGDRPSQTKNTLNGLLPTKNLNLQLPKDGIEEKMIPRADLVLPRPWNPVERKDLGFRV